MNTQTDIVQETQKQAAANRLSQTKNQDKTTAQFVDQRPETLTQHKLQKLLNNSEKVKQMKALQAMANSYTLKKNREQSPVQRVVKTKTGYIDGSDSEILAIQAPPIKAMMLSEETYLMQSTKDMRDYRTQERADVPVLTPHKHLIGESHNNSRFEEAVKDWGFAAPQMREGLNDHPHMKDTNAEKRTNDPTDKAFKAKPLENTVTKALGELLLAKERVDRMKKAVLSYLDIEKRISSLKHGPVESMTTAKTSSFKNLVNFSGHLLERWTELEWVLDCASNYVSSVDGSQLAQLPLGSELKTEIVDKIGTIRQILAGVLSQLKLQNSSEVETLHVKENWLKLLDEKVIIPLLGRFHGILLTELNNDDSATVLERGIGTMSGFLVMNTSREHFMTNNIVNNIDAPSLIQIGSRHLPGLIDRAIPKTKYYESYEAFQAATKGVLNNT